MYSCASRASCTTALMSCVPRALHALMLHVPRTLRAFVPYLPRALCAFMLYLPCALYALEPYVPRVLRLLVPHVPCVISALVPQLPRCLCALVFHVPRVSRISCPMWSRASLLMSPFSLRTLLFRTLRTLCLDITFCTLEFPCIKFLLLCSFTTCDFLGEVY